MDTFLARVYAIIGYHDCCLVFVISGVRWAMFVIVYSLVSLLRPTHKINNTHPCKSQTSRKVTFHHGACNLKEVKVTSLKAATWMAAPDRTILTISENDSYAAECTYNRFDSYIVVFRLHHDWIKFYDVHQSLQNHITSTMYEIRTCSLRCQYGRLFPLPRECAPTSEIYPPVPDYIDGRLKLYRRPV